ncbi:TIGR04500 family putative peptide maturation system protein [Spongiactinospora sp. TRM90649]|uniref:TIGR04500 family putative peptide maturation system protein n=1 Tax=Spongiactinospora sp. TRM90649 TaxID=3031114 RepID=UPI0023F8B2BF|nr:TIGR04500 family putative peptide maturation system protein [Spongiactinospora sp. TRM90649]MDF5754128.1 TIGR04500 family putative peptide maturation system protein [Spongiactinospora sp. TRM90649]
MTGYADTLASAVEMLRGLPRRRDAVPGARGIAAEWRAANPGCRAQLVVDDRPGSPVVDYDLLIDHPEGGTVALTASVDDGVPWTVDHSTHWAAGKVLSVNGQELSVQTALLSMRAYGERHRTLPDDLIEHCLLLLETWDDQEPTDEEMQRASDEFRRRRGLHDRAGMLRWLEAVGLTGQAYENHLFSLVRASRFRERKAAELGAAYLAGHAADFDRVSAVWAVGPRPVLDELAADGDPVAAIALAVAAGAGELSIQVAERAAAELPEPLRHATEGTAVGPVPYGDAFLLGAVRERRPAPHDDATLAAAGRAAFAAFMVERRAKATIEWYWP